MERHEKLAEEDERSSSWYYQTVVSAYEPETCSDGPGSLQDRRRVAETARRRHRTYFSLNESLQRKKFIFHNAMVVGAVSITSDMVSLQAEVFFWVVVKGYTYHRLCAVDELSWVEAFCVVTFEVTHGAVVSLGEPLMEAVCLFVESFGARDAAAVEA